MTSRNSFEKIKTACSCAHARTHTHTDIYIKLDLENKGTLTLLHYLQLWDHHSLGIPTVASMLPSKSCLFPQAFSSSAPAGQRILEGEAGPIRKVNCCVRPNQFDITQLVPHRVNGFRSGLINDPWVLSMRGISKF